MPSKSITSSFQLGGGGSEIKASGPHGLSRTDISHELSGRLLITDLHAGQRELTICPDNPLPALIPAPVPQLSLLPQETPVSEVNQTRHFSRETASHAAVCESPRQAGEPKHKQWKHLFCGLFFPPVHLKLSYKPPDKNKCRTHISTQAIFFTEAF